MFKTEVCELTRLSLLGYPQRQNDYVVCTVLLFDLSF